MSTSATESNYEHGQWNVRTPRTASMVARRHSSSRGWLRWAQSSLTPFRAQVAGARPVERSRVRGSRPRELTSRIASCTSHRDRSRRELCPNLIGSDTSCRKLVALQAGGSCFAGASFPSALDEPARRPSAFASARLSDVGQLAAGRHPLGPPLTLLREELRNQPHPRCLPSSDGPVRGRALSSTICPQPVDYGASASSIFARPQPLTRP